MPSIIIAIISHELKIDPIIKSIAKKRRALGEEKRLEMMNEVGKLLNVGFVKETHVGGQPSLGEKHSRESG